MLWSKQHTDGSAYLTNNNVLSNDQRVHIMLTCLEYRYFYAFKEFKYTKISDIENSSSFCKIISSLTIFSELDTSLTETESTSISISSSHQNFHFVS